MSKLRALAVSTLLAAALVGGTASMVGGTEAGPINLPLGKSGPQWCC